jgi:hypothetical protein
MDGGGASDATATAAKVSDASASPVHAFADQGEPVQTTARIGVVASSRVDGSNVGPAVNREPAILVDYKEAAYLLSLCRPKVGDTSPEQAEVRGVNALKQRVASGRLPARCIKRSGRRVQFVRMALVEWASGRGKVRA